MDLLVEKQFVIVAVDSFLGEESCEYSSVVEVLVFLIVINLVLVDIIRYVFGNFNKVVDIGGQVSILD